MKASFDLISLIAGILCIHALWLLAQNWGKFWDDRVTAKDKELVQRLVLFVFVPIGVLLHEIGHTVATWQVGGTVAEFQWRFYWGFIVPVGDFSRLESWWIGFSGNLVSILLGLLPIPFIPFVRKRIVGELFYTFACVQLIYSLVAYPFTSFGLRGGDWFRLYQLTVQPYTGLMAIVHLGLIAVLWQLNYSQKMLDWRLAANPNERQLWSQLKVNVASSPRDLQAHLDLAYFLLQNREIHAAKQVNRKIGQIASNDERTRVFRAVLDCSSQNYWRAIRAARKLLGAELLLEDKLRVYRVLCFSYSQLSQLKNALFYANEGLTFEPNDYRLRGQRALLYQRLGQSQNAIADLDIALEQETDEDCRQQLQQHREQLL